MLSEHNTQRLTRFQLLLWLLLLVLVTPRDLIASSIPHIWTELYKELNDGARPMWQGRKDAHAWARSEQTRLEPLVIEILRGERSDAAWSGSVLFVARVIPTDSVRDVLLLRVHEVVENDTGIPSQLTGRNVGALSRAIDVFAKAGDIRILPTVFLLMEIDNQEYAVLEHCAMALRTIGNQASLRKLHSIPLRERDRRFDRLCALTEKIIEARIEGKAFPSEKASEELQAVTSRFLIACEAADLKAYNTCFPWGFHKVRDEGDMHEFLDGEHGEPALAAIQAALDTNTLFEIDRASLKAQLDCDGQYVLEYIYEVDGWKVWNVRPSRPAAKSRPPIEYPKNDTKRVIIGKPESNADKP